MRAVVGTLNTYPGGFALENCAGCPQIETAAKHEQSVISFDIWLTALHGTTWHLMAPERRSWDAALGVSRKSLRDGRHP